MNDLPTYVQEFHDKDVISEMTYQKLGNTDMIVSRMTFGGTAIGGLYGQANDEESILVIMKALKSGFNMIDTAPWYGHGKSETVLGKVLPSIPRKAYYLNTKVCRYFPEPEKMFDFRGERVIQSIDESLHRLGVEYLDVAQVHDMEFAPSLDVVINETLPALQKMREAGKIRYIGITGYPLEDFKTVIDRSAVKIDTILTYCHASMNDSTLREYLPYFQSKGLGIINGSILSMGLLTERGPAQWHPASADIRKVCKEAVDYSKRKNCNIARIATQYSLNFPGVHTTLIGTSSLANLQTSIDVLRKGITTEEQIVSDELMEKFFKPMKKPTWEGIEVEKYRRKLQKATNR